MTNQEIDNLTGDALDRAIAGAMESGIDMPNRFGPRWSPANWWFNIGGNNPAWVPARKFDSDEGGIAMALLEKMKEWNWLCILDQGDIAWRMTANYFGDDQERTCEAAGDFTIAVARLFLRVFEARKAVTP